MSNRDFRTPESYAAERITRDMLADFLRSVGFWDVRDDRKPYGKTESQTIHATTPNGERLTMRVRLCWHRTGEWSRNNTYSAAQLLPKVKNRENQSTLTLIDYKTGSRQNVSRQQLNLYAYALSPGKWNPFELQYQFLKTGEISEWKYTAQLHSTTEQWLMSLIDKIENSKILFKNKTRLCDYCGVSHHCYRVP